MFTTDRPDWVLTLLLAAALAVPGHSPWAQPASEPPVTQGETEPPSVAHAEHDAAAAQSRRLIPGGLVDLQTVLGFSDTFRLGRWTPVTVVVGNRGRDLVGHVEVQTTEGDVFQENVVTTSHRRRLELPRDSRKRLRFTVFLDSFSRPLVVRIVAGGHEVARRDLELRHRFTDANLIVVVSRDADLDYLNDSAGATRRVVYPHPEFLPDRWQGYDGVAAVVIHGTSLEELGTAQFEALKRWLAQGGVVAVSGGPDYALLRTPRLAELLPGTPVGVERFPDGAAVGAALGEPLEAARPFGVNRLVEHRGRVVHRAGDTPLVIEEARGRGRVLYLTFDVARYPFDTWPGMTRLWLSMLHLPPAQPVSYRALEQRKESPVLTVVGARPANFPNHTTLLFFFALYLATLATGYRLRPARTAGRRWVRWTTWASPLIFTPAAYLLFGPVLFPKGASAVIVSVIEPFSPGPYARLEVDVGMFSSRRHPLRLDYAGADPVFRPGLRPSRRTKTSRWVIGDDGERSVLADDYREYILHLLEGRDVIGFDMQGTATETEAGVRLQVRNSSGRELRDAWMVLDGRAYPLGSIPEDGDVHAVLDAESDGIVLHDDAWQAILAAAAGRPDPEVHVKGQLLENALERLREDDDPGLDDAVLVGFSSSPLRLARASASWQAKALALVLYRLPVARLPREPETFDDGPM